MENKFIQNTYKPVIGTFVELYDTLSKARDPEYHHLMGYLGCEGPGKIYHLRGCTVRISKGGRTFPLNVSGDSENVKEAVSKLEELSGIGLEKIS
jgi:hypothetical protein